MSIVLTPLQILLFSMMLDDLIMTIINEIAGLSEDEVNARIELAKINKQKQIDEIKNH